MARRLPKWKTRNLKRHHRDHPVDEARCWRDLTGLQVVSEDDYEEASQEVFEEHWYAYEAEFLEANQDYVTLEGGARVMRSRLEYQSARTTFVDDRMVLAVTDLSQTYFVTCYHEHYGKGHVEGQHRDRRTLGERRDEYKRSVAHKVKARRLRSLEVLKDETT